MAGPTIILQPTATLNANGKTVALSVLADDPAGESTLIYRWSVTGPFGVTFSDNSTNTAKSCTATLKKTGTYIFGVTVTDQSGLAVGAAVSIIVAQVLTLLTLTPGSAAITTQDFVQFQASTRDQFLQPMAVQPAATDFTWSVTGAGIITTTGFYLAPAIATRDTITVGFGGLSHSSIVTITVNTLPQGITISGTIFTVRGTSFTNICTATVVIQNPPLVTVTLTCKDSGGNVVFSQSLQAAATRIQYYGQNGVNHNFTNSTPANSNAAGGSGVNTLVGGMAQNILIGGLPGSTNTLTGGFGNTTFIDGGGTNTFNSRSKSDVILTGPGTNTVTQVLPARSLTFDPVSGIMTIIGTDYSNNILVNPYTTSNGLQLLLASITSSDTGGHTTFTASAQPLQSQVSYVCYYGQQGGSSSFQNLSPIPCVAYGGSATNLLQAGTGNDYLVAGGSPASNNTLKGGAGDDVLIGGPGTNYLYGGSGNNQLIAGPPGSVNYLFPSG